MTVYVALLRGINVGGRAVLPMERLRAVAADCGFGAVRSYIQSGNLVFTADQPAPEVARTLEQAVAAAGGPAPRVALRSRTELAAVVAASPFPTPAPEPRQAHVFFLVEGAEPPSLAGLDLDGFAPETLTVRGRETFLFLPGGIGRSKLAETIARRHRTDSTARNWRTVSALLEMAESTPDS